MGCQPDAQLSLQNSLAPPGYAVILAPHSTGVTAVRQFPMLNDLSCDICGSQMIEQKCKIRCPNCGYTRDCSDP